MVCQMNATVTGCAVCNGGNGVIIRRLCPFTPGMFSECIEKSTVLVPAVFSYKVSRLVRLHDKIGHAALHVALNNLIDQCFIGSVCHILRFVD